MVFALTHANQESFLIDLTGPDQDFDGDSRTANMVLPEMDVDFEADDYVDAFQQAVSEGVEEDTENGQLPESVQQASSAHCQTLYKPAEPAHLTVATNSWLDCLAGS